MAISKWNELQLKFDLDLDEAREDAEERAITPEEARLISEAARQAWEHRGSEAWGLLDRTPDWMKDYTMLREQGWPWRVACYMAWASSPKAMRKPQTLAELATEVLGLTGPRVIYTWRKKYPSIDTVISMMQAAPLWEHRRDVLEALVTMAKSPDYKSFNDRKLFLEMIGDYVPKSMLGVGKPGKDGQIEGMSDEDLKQWLGEAQDAEETEDAGE